MRFTVKVEWQQEHGTVATAEFGKLDCRRVAFSNRSRAQIVRYKTDPHASAEHCDGDASA
jgi:hypothetical protein